MLKNKISLLFILAFIVVIGYIGCDEDSGVGPTPPQDEGPQLSDDTYVIEESDSFSLSEQEADSIYTFGYTREVPEITAGKIIAGKIIENDSLKGGYLRRVSSIDTLDNQLKIETEFASLSEAVEHGEIDTTFQLTISENNMLRSSQHELARMQMVHAVEGVSVTDYGIDLSGVELYSGSAHGVDLDVTITDGEVSFEPIFNFGGKIEWFNLTEFHTTVEGKLKFDCTVQATASGKLENYSKEKTIASFSYYAYQQIGPLPVVEKITLSFIAGFDLDAIAELSVQSGFESEYTLEIGARYNQDWSPSWQKVWEHDPDCQGIPVTWNQSADVTLKGYIKACIDVKLYTVAGPYLEGKPYLEFDANIQTVPVSSWNWDLYAGVSGDLGFLELEILDYELGKFNEPLPDLVRTKIDSSSSEKAPTVTINSPNNGATFSAGDPINFEGGANDPQDGVLSGSDLIWTSDKDGQIGTGTSFSKDDLTINKHTITLKATDSDGDTGTNMISITVGESDHPPIATITSPDNGDRFLAGETITFLGQGTDEEDGALPPSSLVWDSDKDGFLGNGESLEVNDLSLGEHLITLTCTDSDSNSDSDNITVYVDFNHDPVATIIEPSDGSSFDDEETITFNGQGTDEEDGVLSGSSLVWTSDKDGFIGTGNTLNTSDLSVNEHVITLTASDSHGNTGSDIITITVYSSSGGDLVRIPAGTFTMGSPTDEPSRDSDETQHTVTLTHDFLISETEVTNQHYADLAQWAYDNGYCTATSSSLQDDLDGSAQELLDLDDSDCEISFSGGRFTVDSGKENHPVKEVSWYGAASYCDWLSIKARFNRAYNHSTWQCNGNDPYNAEGFRLPTEAEWEYACRAGTQTPFNTGECLDAGREANYNGNYPYTGCSSGPYEGWTVPVASYPANGFGLYDMHGNVWEWCNDWYGSYGGDETDPVGPISGTYRGLRGGGWGYYAQYCRSALRDWLYPTGTFGGFRVCRGALAR